MTRFGLKEIGNSEVAFIHMPIVVDSIGLQERADTLRRINGIEDKPVRENALGDYLSKCYSITYPIGRGIYRFAVPVDGLRFISNGVEAIFSDPRKVVYLTTLDVDTSRGELVVPIYSHPYLDTLQRHSLFKSMDYIISNPQEALKVSYSVTEEMDKLQIN